eukprot:1578620-Amphidinium_carterae.1
MPLAKRLERRGPGGAIVHSLCWVMKSSIVARFFVACGCSERQKCKKEPEQIERTTKFKAVLRRNEITPSGVPNAFEIWIMVRLSSTV